MRLIIIEDNERLSGHLKACFEAIGYETEVVATLDQARVCVQRGWPDFVLLDAYFPTYSGELPEFNAATALDLLTARNRQRPAVLLMSGDDKAAVQFQILLEWLGTGRIADILPKATSGGWDFLTQLLVHRIEILRSLRFGSAEDDEEKHKQWLLGQGIITEERSMLDIAAHLKRIVGRTPNNTSILIWGPSGSGKGLLARAIHSEMERKAGKKLPFEHVDCGEIMDTTAATQLLGDIKGTFTGSLGQKGKLDRAGDGLLLLDNIHRLPREAQGALLSPLEERTYSPVGPGVAVRPNFRARVVSTTNVPFRQLYDDKLMSTEFYHRIAREYIALPTLAQRRRDIERLMKHFLSTNSHGGVQTFHDDVVKAFQSHEWPGDVRQLKNIVERIAISALSRVITLEEVKALHLVEEGQPIVWCSTPVLENRNDVLLQRFGWDDGWKSLKDADFDRVRSWIESVWPDKLQLIAQWSNGIRDEVKPKAIHYLKALLFLSVAEGNTADHAEVEETLDLSWDWTNRVLKHLAGESNHPGEPKPPFIQIHKGRKLIYQLGKTLLEPSETTVAKE